MADKKLTPVQQRDKAIEEKDAALAELQSAQSAIEGLEMETVELSEQVEDLKAQLSVNAELIPEIRAEFKKISEEFGAVKSELLKATAQLALSPFSEQTSGVDPIDDAGEEDNDEKKEVDISEIVKGHKAAGLKAEAAWRKVRKEYPTEYQNFILKGNK